MLTPPLRIFVHTSTQKVISAVRSATIRFQTFVICSFPSAHRKFDLSCFGVNPALSHCFGRRQPTALIGQHSFMKALWNPYSFFMLGYYSRSIRGPLFCVA